MGGSDNLEDYEQVEMESLTITEEDGTEKEYAIINIFEVDGKQYIALWPVLEDDYVDDETVLFFYYEEGEDGEVILDGIESEEEMDMLAAIYEEWGSEEELE